MFTWKKVFVVLLISRVLLTLLPQTGYIHPDEFFQSAEIIAGDALDLEVLRTWEFNCTSPIRSIVLPYITIGLPIWILKTSCAINPYLVLMVPRLLMATLSISTDVFLRRICTMLSTKHPFQKMSLHASSYVVLTFLPRTLSNSLEYFLFAAAMYLVIKHLTQLTKVSRRKTNTRLLALVMATGFFNRPTFICFAFVPGLAWLYGFLRLNLRLAEVSSHFLHFTATFLATSFTFIFFDSLYYNQGSSGSLVVTPYNFLSYNTDTSKLNLHGLHPRITHMFLNVPMLFGVLGIAGYFTLAKWVLVAVKKGCLNISLSDRLMMASFLLPILLLSAFPHQEARFIIPVFFPLVFIASNALTSGGKWFTRLMVGLWIFGNVAGLLFFGFVHQGGVIPALFYLNHLDTESKSVIFYRTYMPPRHVLLMNTTSPKYSVRDVMGGSLYSLRETLNIQSLHNDILLVSPTSLRHQIIDSILNWHFVFLKRFACHVSTEDPPQFNGILNYMGLDIHQLKRLS